MDHYVIDANRLVNDIKGSEVLMFEQVLIRVISEIYFLFT